MGQCPKMKSSVSVLIMENLYEFIYFALPVEQLETGNQHQPSASDGNLHKFKSPVTVILNKEEPKKEPRSV